MKLKGSDYFVHGLFVDEIMQVYPCDDNRDKFLALQQKDSEVTGGVYGLCERNRSSCKVKGGT